MRHAAFVVVVVVLAGLAACTESRPPQPPPSHAGSAQGQQGQHWATPTQHPQKPHDDDPKDDGVCAPRAGSRDFAVGPGQKHASLGDVPFEQLRAGDTVRIFWRDEPYHEKLMIGGIGTADAPIRVCGVPSADGKLPVIDGQDATTRPMLDFPFDGHQQRGLVIIGHPHGQPWTSTPRFIVLQGLEIRNAGPPYSFTDKSGKKTKYSNIAAGIFVERADHVTIRGCTITANNNGLFVASSDDDTTLTKHVLVEGNWIHGNGSLEDYYEHNVYNEASGVVYQWNRFGSPRGGKDGVLGANIKDRSAGVVIRYNWIEDGAHVLDLVDAQEARALTRTMPSFHATYVYGNVIIRGKTPLGSLIHYGGDSGVFENYRKGTLFFYDNTVVIRNASFAPYTVTEIFELSTNEEHLDSRNNVFWSEVAPDETHPIVLLGERDRVTSGIAAFAGDWMRRGWTEHEALGKPITIRAQATGLDKLTRGDDPGFRDPKNDDFTLKSQPPNVTPVSLEPPIPKPLLPTLQYVKHQKSKPRAPTAPIGALSD